ncbi:hypothetical protein V5799_024331 [Amblyomma americanum]|uniref:Uncharacterized protein n=1 Tax=Amblyomma americanum TaxID=6943 RepID=A0AAQ4ECL6_AMBAM
MHFGYKGRLFVLKPSALDHLILNAAIEEFHVDGLRMSSTNTQGLLRAMVRGQPVGIQLSYEVELCQRKVTMFADYIQSTAALKELALVQVGLKVVEIIALFNVLESSKMVEVLKLEVNMVGIRGEERNSLRSFFNRTRR